MLPLKWENLSRCSTKLIHVCKKLPLELDCRRSKYSQWIYNIHIFSILGMAFEVLFLCYFQKLLLLAVKNFFLKQFLLHGTSIFTILKSVSQIFKILFQTGDINDVLRGVFFSRYVQLRSSSSDEKNISGEISDIL